MTPLDLRSTRGSLLAGLVPLLLLTPWTAAQVRGHHKISDGMGGFTGLTDADWLGSGIAALGDLDGNGVGDLAIGTPMDDSGGAGRDLGAVWILFRGTNGDVIQRLKITSGRAGFTGVLTEEDQFGTQVAPLGDLDGNGVADIAVGAPFDDTGGPERGAFWILFLEATGRVLSHQKISDLDGGFSGLIRDGATFGRSLTWLGDLDGDGTGDLAVGAPDLLEPNRTGSVWILFLNPGGTVKSAQQINSSHGGFEGLIEPRDLFGTDVEALGDVDGDGVVDLAVAAQGDDDGAVGAGAAWILFLKTDGTVKGHSKISALEGGLRSPLHSVNGFGSSLGSVQLDGDGIPELIVGALDDDGDGLPGSKEGAIFVLYLDDTGTVRNEFKVNDVVGGFTPNLESDRFGRAVSCMPDLDGDGLDEILVGAIFDDDGGRDRGAVWTLFLDASVRHPSRTRPRNGAGTNPSCLSEVTRAVLGTAWSTEVATARPDGTPVVLAGFLQGGTGQLTSAGELLVSGPRVFRTTALVSGGVAPFDLVLPSDPALLDLTFHAQALVGGRPLQLCNALEVVLGTF